MSTFKVGDKVIRTEPYFAYPDRGFMQEGTTYTVSELIGDKEILLEGGDVGYLAKYFELVESASKFKRMKFHVKSPEQAKDVQEALFSLGYVWLSGAKDVSYLELHWDDYVVTYPNGMFSSTAITCNKFSDVPEYTLGVKKTYEFIPVEAQEETIELMGKKYSKKALEDALRDLKEL